MGGQLQDDCRFNMATHIWCLQACTEQYFPTARDGKDDMFWDQPWDEAAMRRSCWDKWRVVPRPMWAAINWGGRNIQTASNIVFSNGKLDPWSGGGVLEVSAVQAWIPS
jgi:lysosomal Pro-X carboxypeptidase